jgi:CheY-like chemotaxis protein
MFRYNNPGPTKTEVFEIRRIMLVDDEKDILRVIKRGLEDEVYLNSSSSGCDGDGDIRFIVDTFSDAESALQSFHEHPDGFYDLIVFDLRMKRSGFELYKEMKRKNSTLRFVFLTACEYIDKQQFENYLLNTDHIIAIAKPISISKLRPRLVKILCN